MPMHLLVAAALAILPPETRVSAAVQATVTIRIVAGVALKLDGSSNPNAPAARDSTVKLADGTRQSAKLIEFQ